MAKAVKRFALSGRTHRAAATMAEITEQGLINIRAQTDDKALMEALTQVLGAALPIEINTITSAPDGQIFWLGPDEWLARMPDARRAATLTALQKATRSFHAAIVDVSDYYTIIQLSGDVAKELLTAACPLDIDRMTTESCAQSHFAKAAILLYKKEASVFDIQVRWSYAEYVWKYLRLLSGE